MGRRSVALLTLNRPEKLNALNYATNDRLLQLLDHIEENSEVRAVIITGAGDRAFSAGADIHEFSAEIKQDPQVAAEHFVSRGQKMTARMEAFPKPIIAAVNGIAYGGGCEITEAVHIAIAIAIASERAVFAKPEINIGIPPTFGGTQRLPRLAGRKRALELLLTEDSFTPQRAYEMGIINTIVAHDDLAAAAFDMATCIIRHSPVVISGILTAVTRGLNMTIDEGLKLEAEQFATVAQTPDTHEGLTAWIEKRRPQYQGR